MTSPEVPMNLKKHNHSSMKTRIAIFIIASTMLVSCTNPSTSNSATEKEQVRSQTIASSSKKPQVRDLLKSIETGEPGAAESISTDRYVQHNLSIADGLEGFGAVLQQLPKGSARVETARIFQDGEYVFAHTDYNFFGPKIGFDVFRFENGKIVEHWDNLQEKPADLNQSGHSMIDGPTTATDLENTDANKTLVRNFVDDVLNNGRMEKSTQYFDGDNYIQHNPQIGDGLSGLGAALEELGKQGIVVKYDRIHHVLGEGNFVLVASEGSFGGKHTSFYDLFRVENGKIAEHWDTLETIRPKDQWKNDNGKF